MHNKVIINAYLTSNLFLQKNVLYFFFTVVTQWYSNKLLALVFLTRHPHPSPMPIYVSVPLEVSKCLIQRNFGWGYAIGRALRMFPKLHVCSSTPFLSKSPTAKFNATSAGGMLLAAVDVCSPIARLLLNIVK